jgi:hypothetical protein
MFSLEQTNMKKHLSLLILGVVLGVLTVNAQSLWVSFKDFQSYDPKITLANSSNELITIDVEVPGMYRETINYEGKTFDRLSLPQGARFGHEGSPEIPFYQKLLAIPECDGASITVLAKDSLIFDNYYVYPVPHMVKDSSNGKVQLVEGFSYNEAKYSQNEFVPNSIAVIDNFGYFRSQKLAQILINPLRFNPVRHQLIVYQDFEITIKYNNPRSEKNVNVGIFDNVASHSFLNFTASGLSASSKTSKALAGSVTTINLQNVAQASTIVADYLIIVCKPPYFSGHSKLEFFSCVSVQS